MAVSAVEELRRIRTAEIDDPQRVVEIGRRVLGKRGFASAGDECRIPSPIKLPDVLICRLDNPGSDCCGCTNNRR